jgi:hypothetical protein
MKGVVVSGSHVQLELRLWTLMMLALLLLRPSDARAAKPTPTIEVPITIHVARVGDDAVVTTARIEAALARARRELEPFGIVLVVRAIEVLPMQDADIDDGEQRFGLADTAARDGSVHVFYVERLELTNPRKGDRRVSGMHWRYHGLDRTHRRREYVAIAHNAPATTLVHELGHAFGLNHEDDFDNLMCSCRRGQRPAFTSKQGKRMRSGAKRFLARAS